MTARQFNLIKENKFCKKVLINGSCIAQRDTNEGEALLFQIGKYYVEIFFDGEGSKIINSRCFVNTDELVPYLMDIDISDLKKKY